MVRINGGSFQEKTTIKKSLMQKIEGWDYIIIIYKAHANAKKKERKW